VDNSREPPGDATPDTAGDATPDTARDGTCATAGWTAAIIARMLITDPARRPRPRGPQGPTWAHGRPGPPRSRDHAWLEVAERLLRTILVLLVIAALLAYTLRRRR
jgi:hypothetical protein